MCQEMDLIATDARDETFAFPIQTLFILRKVAPEKGGRGKKKTKNAPFFLRHDKIIDNGMSALWKKKQDRREIRKVPSLMKLCIMAVIRCRIFGIDILPIELREVILIHQNRYTARRNRVRYQHSIRYSVESKATHVWLHHRMRCRLLRITQNVDYAVNYICPHMFHEIKIVRRPPSGEMDKRLGCVLTGYCPNSKRSMTTHRDQILMKKCPYI